MPRANLVRVLVPLAYRMSPEVYEEIPVPPLFARSTPESVIVPLDVTGLQETVNPVPAAEKPTEVTVPFPVLVDIGCQLPLM